MSNLAIGPQCCCECGPCDSKETLGLPDDLTINFNLLTSDDTGMPADADIGTCAGGDPFMRFTHDAAIVELLSAIIFDYIEAASVTSCGCCCHRYEGRKEYDTECPGGTNDGILLGPSPFEPTVTGESYQQGHFTGTSVFDPDPGDLFDGCCVEGTPCIEVCGETYSFDGVQDLPLNAYLPSAELLICVQGEVVTICLSLSVAVECQTKTGEYVTTNQGIDIDDCSALGYSTTDDTVTACGTNTASTIYLTATADLTGVAGATLWDKMKAAPTESWVSDYETVHCNCGTGGCVDSIETHQYTCQFDEITCLCESVDDIAVIESDYPVDRDCLYAVGTIDLGFAEA